MIAGVDVCLWVRPVGITYKPRFLEPSHPAAHERRQPTALPWRLALLLPLIVIAPLVLRATLTVVTLQPSTAWTPGVVGAAILGSLCLTRLWLVGSTHRWRALIVAETVLVALLLATAALPSGDVALTLRLSAVFWTAAFAFAAATRGGTRSADRATPPPITAPPGPR